MPDNASAADSAKTAKSPLAAATTPESSDASGDAAMRAFAVPQLLEHILCLAVIDQQVKDREAILSHKHHLRVLKMWPMLGSGNVSNGGICLFRIQRVNKIFRDTIQGSTKLKQLIYLAPRPNTELMSEDCNEDGWLPLHKPLTAFLWGIDHETKGKMLAFDGAYEAVEGVETLIVILGDAVFDGPGTPYENTIGKSPQHWRSAEASWRTIKVCNARDPLRVKVSISGELGPSDSHLQLGEIVWELDEEATLGYVFDLLSELLNALESLQKSRDVQEAYCADEYQLFRKLADGKRQQLEDQLEAEEEAFGARLEQERKSRSDQITNTIRGRLEAFETQRALRTVSDSQ